MVDTYRAQPCPRLNFACELEIDALETLLAGGTVIDDLAELGASISLGILDHSARRAAVVRRLNEAGIPVVAWQLLPKEEGYWFTLNNAPQAVALYATFQAWTAEYGLRWQGIALDVEPDFNELARLWGGQRLHLLPVLVRRVLDTRQLHAARAAYHTLVAQMQADGYRVATCQFPFMVDERAVGSTLLQRLFGVVDIPADEQMVMLYSALSRPIGPAVLWSYAPDSRVIGIGTTGGGVDLGDNIRLLDWDEFARDLRMARRWCQDLAIFSLEGCIEQGFLARLKTFDWDAPPAPPIRAAGHITRLRGMMRGALWASAHPSVVLGGLGGMAGMALALSQLARPRGATA